MKELSYFLMKNWEMAVFHCKKKKKKHNFVQNIGHLNSIWSMRFLELVFYETFCAYVQWMALEKLTFSFHSLQKEKKGNK